MAKEELTDELNVTEKFMLALHLNVSVILSSVCLTSIFSLLLEGLEVFLTEDLLIDGAAIVEQLLAEVAELEIVLPCRFSL